RVAALEICLALMHDTVAGRASAAQHQPHTDGHRTKHAHAVYHAGGGRPTGAHPRVYRERRPPGPALAHLVAPWLEVCHVPRPARAASEHGQPAATRSPAPGAVLPGGTGGPGNAPRGPGWYRFP